MLSEGEESFSTDDAFGSDESSMEELLSLLGTEEEAQPTNDMTTEETDASPQYLAEEQNVGATKAKAANQQSDQAMENLADEVSYLENLLAEKNSEKQRLENEIQSFDQRIAQLEAQLSSPESYAQPKFAASSSEYEPTNNTPSESVNETQTSTSFSTDFSSNSIDDFEITYQDALQLFHEHRYQNAIAQFYQLLQINPRHKLADNCQYWIGECYYAQGKYYQAIAEFNKVAAFDAADKKDDAQLMLGLAFLKLGEKRYAQTELDWLISTFASSEYLDKAYRYLNQL